MASFIKNIVLNGLKTVYRLIVFEIVQLLKPGL